MILSVIAYMIVVIGLPMLGFYLFSKFTSSLTEDCMAQPAKGVPEWHKQ